MTQNHNNIAGRTITIPAFSERVRKLTTLAIGAVSVFLIFTLLFAPFYKTTSFDEYGDKVHSTVRAIDIFRTRDISPDGDISIAGDLFTIESLVLFIAIVALCVVGAGLVFAAARRLADTETHFYGSVQNVIFYSTLVCGLYYLSSLILSAIRNAGTATSHYAASRGAQFWLCFAIAIIFAYLTRAITFTEEAPKPKNISVGARIELFFYALVITALAVACALGDIIWVKFDIEIDDVYFNGLEALTGVIEVTGGLQVLVFFVLAFVAANVALFLLSLTALAGRSRLFYQIALVEIIGGALTTFVIGLFGKYFAIAQEINADILNSWISFQLDQYGFGGLIDPETLGLNYDIQSPSHWFFVAAVGVLCLVLLRRPYTRGTKGELIVAVGTNAGIYDPTAGEEQIPEDNAPALPGDHDPCPAFTGIDRKAESLRAELETAQASAFESPTLPEIVNFVVNYARDSRLHLYYTPEDIATFIAGLGTTRLTILQGMSGTGKTSLPKIFAEAILGSCDLVEVESAWRDKNELLGYYNEFSKIYTPKKFTLALYRARLFPERPTFIVLDEMNLSRIEYYFSDFLSLMENEEDRREIKLLGTPLYRKHDGRRYRYMGLFEGTTIRIPKNVWFVGTANRDESTFEISDKVYDRAHTMNFNKRAPKIRITSEPMQQRFLSSAELCRLFDEAKASVYFDIESHSVVGEVEALLAPYNISFGNRIANQIEDFVRIYAACFGGTEKALADGLERILLSKVVAKLEFKSVENKEELAAEFERLRLYRCRDFVLSLNED
jgi:hypothetical protein